MDKYAVALENITKTFGRRLIFNKLNYIFSSSNVYGIAGQNGSGKSTLSKIIGGLITPTKGKVIHSEKEKEIIDTKLPNYLGFVSPYLVLYDEFTALENLEHFAHIRGMKYDKERAKYLLQEFSLYERRKDYLKGYSSGMKQRMKFIFALFHKPRILLLDEPTSNLDIAGKDKVYEIIEREGRENLVIIASNEESDLALCGEIVRIEDFKTL
ncbi:MAG: ABC transporter ATP-binding protein [Chlorobi bacterium]|nr:ABC transporter ATP-binding protein [Chlorobiota bacterium]